MKLAPLVFHGEPVCERVADNIFVNSCFDTVVYHSLRLFFFVNTVQSTHWIGLSLGDISLETRVCHAKENIVFLKLFPK